jgi:hypothetical protein
MLCLIFNKLFNPLAPELLFFFLISAHTVYKMQRLQVSGAVRLIYGSLGVKRLTLILLMWRIW